MRPWEDEDDEGPFFEDFGEQFNPEYPFAFLHGVWRDEVRGSTMYVYPHTGRPYVAYCSGGDHELTGMYELWRFDGRQFVARWRWRQQPLAGYVVLQIETQDSLVGGWWYERDVPADLLPRLPFVPGINPCRWVRQSPTHPWPDWAADQLGTVRGCTSASLIARIPRRPPQPARREALAHTSEHRYRRRLTRWTDGLAGLPRLAARLRHHGWWLAHNLLAHPLLALAPLRPSVALHDWTSHRLNLDDTLVPSPPPRIEHRFWWFVHNLISHPAIGLFPCARTFRWHDLTARRMAVRGWL
jgi:hypothetical protein